LDKPVASAPSIVLPDTFPQLLSGCETMPEFTNFAVDFVDTLDYILASELSKGETYGFSLTKSACMPTLDDVKKFVAMPNEFMPSDHVSLVADFAWRTK
jgi:mRNA deadenylase 3'-5' endonuclease subunit Ccr4